MSAGSPSKQGKIDMLFIKHYMWDHYECITDFFKSSAKLYDFCVAR